MGAPTISPAARNTFAPGRFVKVRNGDLYFYDGISRGLRWDGMAATAWPAGVPGPTVAPTLGDSGTSGLPNGTYFGYYRYVDSTAPTASFPTGVPSNLSPASASQAVTNHKIAWSAIPDLATVQSANPRIVAIELYRNTAGQLTTLYLVHTINTTGVTTFTDNISDTALAANTALAIVQPDGSLNAYRFVPPPSFCPFVVVQQDRVMFAGGVKYTAGTVQTAGTTTILGTNTNWNADMVGRYIWITGEPTPLLVSAFNSSTSLTTAVAATTSASGLGYTITPDPQYRNTIFFSEVDEPESVSLTNTITVQENTGDDDEVTGLVRHGMRSYLLKERHIYSVQWIRQPNIDASCFLVTDRGAISDRCACWMDGQMYLMDQAGVFSFDGQKAVSISDSIADLWQQAKIDFSVKQWFWSGADPALRILYFAVSFVGDSSTRPKHALVYHVDSGVWDIDNYIWEVGGGAIIDIGGFAKLLVGIEHDNVLKSGVGLTDIVTTATRGTAAATSSVTTIVDNAGPFSTAMVDAPVAIVAGTGYGQIARITSVTNSNKTLNFAALATAPDATSVYVVGAIQWNHKSGMLEYPAGDIRTKRAIRLNYDPTTHTNSVYLQMTLGYNTVLNQNIFEDRGKGLVSYPGDPNIIIDISENRSALQVDAGFKEWQYSGSLDDKSQNDRWLTVQWSGFQGQDQIRLYRYEIEGAQT